jgi:hypothetical protein
MTTYAMRSEAIPKTRESRLILTAMFSKKGMSENSFPMRI